MIMNNAITPVSERNLYMFKMMLLCAFAFALFFFTGDAHADIFATGKADINSAVNSESTLYFGITVLSLVIAAITGITTKNWFGAVGAFAASMIFIKVAMGMVGIT